MAILEIPVTTVERFGVLDVSPGEADETDGNYPDGNDYNNNEQDVILHIHNTGVVTRNIIIESIDDPYGRQEDIPIAIDAGDTKIVGPLRSIAFGRRVAITISEDSTDLKFWALRFKYN